MIASDAGTIIAVIGGVILIAGLIWAAASGVGDREAEEAARVYFDEHGHWPDEAPDDAELPPGVKRV